MEQSNPRSGHDRLADDPRSSPSPAPRNTHVDDSVAPPPFALALSPIQPSIEPRRTYTANESFKPPSLLLAPYPSTNSFTQAPSSNGSSTVYDDFINAFMAESWSAPTYIESLLENNAFDECKPNPSVEEPFLRLSPSEDVPTVDQISIPLFNIRGSDHNPEPIKPWQPMDRFMSESPPWSTCNPRIPSLGCATCGTSFKEFHRKENMLRHILRCGVPWRTMHWMGMEKPSSYAAKACSRDSASTSSHTSKAATWPMGNTEWQNVAAMGSWRDDRTGMNRKLANAIPPMSAHTSQPRLIACDHPHISHDRLLFLLNSLNPQAYPERTNNFFNGLDIITGNLQERYPDDVMVQGIRKALARLEQLHQLNFRRYASESNQWTSVVTPMAPDNCAPSEGQCNVSLQGRSNTSPSGPNDGNSHSESNSSINSNRGQVPNSLRNSLEKDVRHKNRKHATRLLACPIRKDCEVHDQRPSCSFDGAVNMWGVTQHLKTRVHRQFLPFLTLCRFCWEYSINQEDYDNVHRHGRCQQTAQPRGSKVADSWQGLYGKIFPQSVRIPSPYIDDSHWKPKDTAGNVSLTGPRPPEDNYNFNDLPPAQSFLGQGSMVGGNNHAPESGLQYRNQGITEQDAETVAFELFTQMLREHVQQPADLNDYYMAQLINRVSQMRPEDINAFSDRFFARGRVLIQSLRSHTSDDGIHDARHTNRPVSGVHSSNMSSQNFLPFENSWLGQFPIPQEMLNAVNRADEPQPVQTQSPSQDFAPNDYDLWQDPLTAASALSNPDMDFLSPQGDLPWIPYQIDMFNTEGLRSTIST